MGNNGGGSKAKKSAPAKKVPPKTASGESTQEKARTKTEKSKSDTKVQDPGTNRTGADVPREVQK